MTEKTYDEVNPEHYKGHDGSQAIDVIENFDLNFCTGSATKYILRAGKKPYAGEITELEKAIWYLQREIRNITKIVTDRKPKTGSTSSGGGKTSGAISGGPHGGQTTRK
jgi:hypothetical protein